MTTSPKEGQRMCETVEEEVFGETRMELMKEREEKIKKQ
jgi:hypothetical protein